VSIESSIAIAAELEVCAKEIAAAARLYQRLPAHRASLATALDSLMEALNHHWSRFEAAHDRA
jgi:hypothetical protein